jgi:hypothetical protein
VEKRSGRDVHLVIFVHGLEGWWTILAIFTHFYMAKWKLAMVFRDFRRPDRIQELPPPRPPRLQSLLPTVRAQSDRDLVRFE